MVSGIVVRWQFYKNTFYLGNAQSINENNMSDDNMSQELDGK
jgi:hypothetical protein